MLVNISKSKYLTRNKAEGMINYTGMMYVNSLDMRLTIGLLKGHNKYVIP